MSHLDEPGPSQAGPSQAGPSQPGPSRPGPYPKKTLQDHIKGLDSEFACLIELWNKSLFEFQDFREFLVIGVPHTPLPDEMTPYSRNIFIYKSQSQNGCAGLISCRVDKRLIERRPRNPNEHDNRLYIMWSITSDPQNNVYAIGVNSGLPTDRSTFEMMLNGEEEWLMRRNANLQIEYSNTLFDTPIKVTASMVQSKRTPIVVDFEKAQ